MWHFSHKSPKATKFAKQLLFSLEATGKKVFPDFKTVWHFDDKLGQKYLLESAGIPHAPTYAFYTKKEALAWARETTYPKVFKLRNGSTSDNVKLVHSKRQAAGLIRRAFGMGFAQYRGWSNLKERFRKYRLGKTSIWEVEKGFLRLFRHTDYARVTGREKGYIYFQDFIPGNDHDIRVFVVGDKAYALKRMVRKNDFRASGSNIMYVEKKHFKNEVIRAAFDISEKLQTQLLAMDFVLLEDKPLVVEISYGTPVKNYDACEGYWDRNLKWYEGNFDAAGSMVEEVLAGIKEKSE
jgi:glutathione synthase/RimK-type ligase-like ATP-grasp enzyme